MAFKAVMSPEELSKRVNQTMDLPFHRFLGIKIIKNGPGFAWIELSPTEKTINTAGVIHGGIVYALLDLAAYIAILPLLHDNQNGVTHDIHVSVLRPAPVDSPLLFQAEIRKIGKRIVFCDSEAKYDDHLMATGRLTKSIIEIS